MTKRPPAPASSALPALAATGLIVLLGGCAPPMSQHVAPTSGPQAQLLMRGTLQAGETYGVYLFKDPQKCVGLEKVGVGTVDANPAATTVAANRLSTAEVFVTKPNRTFCRVRWSFVPADRHKYVVTASSTSGGCRAAVLDATDPHHIVPEPSSRRRDVGSQACVPLAQTTTVGDTLSRERIGDDSDLPIPSAPAREAPVRTPQVTEDDLKGLMGK